MNIRPGVAATLACMLAVATTHAQTGKALAALAQNPACQVPKIAAAGGPMPKGQNTIVLRYLGVSKTRATAIFFGHGHWDHIADAPEVAKQTKAKQSKEFFVGR